LARSAGLHTAARPIAATEANRAIDVAARQIDQLDRGRQPHLDVGMRLVEMAEPRQEPAHGKGRQHADRDDPALGPRTHAVHRLGNPLEAVGQATEQTHPRLGQHQPGARALEQRQPQVLLELAHLPADRRRRHGQRVGRRGYAQQAAGGFEGLQCIQ
jgi:hypothetical protein